MKVSGYRWFWIQAALWLIGGPVVAQSELRKANEHFRSYEFAQAITEYQKVLQSRPANLALAQNLAHAYRLNNNSREAESWFAKVLSFPGHEPINIYHYAEALKSNGNYAEARLRYQAYAAKVPAEAAMIAKRVQALDQVQTWLAQPAPVDLQPVASLNSAYADFSPAFFENGIVFASDRPGRTAALTGWTGRPYVQLFYAKKENGGTWSAPAPLEAAVNTASHNGPAAAFPGNNVVYFTRTFIRRDKQQQANTDPTSWTDASGPASDLVNRLAIYSAEKKNGKWINIRPFAYNKVAQYSAGHPALSPDGRYLYFVSDMPGGQGQTDIYFCERRAGGSWSRPLNAGPAINTSGRESFPVVAGDGTLYFSSDGHPGLGGLDLFAAKGEKAAWREVVNLKPPFNSSKDDFGMLWETGGQTGYLSSNRESADGTDNIYAFKPTLAVTAPRASVKRDTTSTPVAGAKSTPTPELPTKSTTEPKTKLTAGPKTKPVVEPKLKPAAEPKPDITAAPQTKPVALSPHLVLRIRTQQQGPGQVARVLPAVALKIVRQDGPRDSTRVSSGARGLWHNPAVRESAYILSAVKPGFLKQSVLVSTAAVTGDTLQVDLLLHRSQAGVPIVLKNIYYNLDQAEIRADAAGELDKLVALLQANPRIKIEISAHTDSRESVKYNLKLSQRRAESVVNYLVDKGVSRERLTARGYGKSRLINNCQGSKPCTEKQHQVNRRTEFKIR